MKEEKNRSIKYKNFIIFVVNPQNILYIILYSLKQFQPEKNIIKTK